MLVTFKGELAAVEQPFAEGSIYNAVCLRRWTRKRLELVKSGNRQPVPVTTRYYSTKTQNEVVFNNADEMLANASI